MAMAIPFFLTAESESLAVWRQTLSFDHCLRVCCGAVFSIIGARIYNYLYTITAKATHSDMHSGISPPGTTAKWLAFVEDEY